MKAKVTVKAIEIRCPLCEETICAPNGSLFWTTEELVEKVCCHNCVKPFLVPVQYIAA
jgi:hypothetical protein